MRLRALVLLAPAATAMLVFAAHTTMAQTSCAALQYLGGLTSVRNDLTTTPPNPVSAATTLRQLVAAYPSSSRTLTPVIADVTAVPPDITDARMAVDDTVRALALPAGAVCDADTSQARSQLSQVYTAPVFAGLDRQPPPSLLDQIGQWLGSLLQRVGGALGTGGSILVGAVLALALIAIAWWRLRGIVAGRAARMAMEPAGDTDDPGREWTLAGRAAARGEYREAIRRAFRSVLLEVARRGRLPVDPAWTTRELLAAARGDASLVALLAPAAAAFDRAWYSGRPVGLEEWDQARSRFEAVRRAARSRAPVEQG
ncbi:MAG: DUF4129 domain-containing protein [Candidatus Dormibacteraeota bacterium]|nr:DUF4129 domain-containing protein [Candidatus Dormibacteraeota bacterium]